MIPPGRAIGWRSCRAHKIPLFAALGSAAIAAALGAIRTLIIAGQTEGRRLLPAAPVPSVSFCFALFRAPYWAASWNQ